MADIFFANVTTRQGRRIRLFWGHARKAEQTFRGMIAVGHGHGQSHDIQQVISEIGERFHMMTSHAAHLEAANVLGDDGRQAAINATRLIIEALNRLKFESTILNKTIHKHAPTSIIFRPVEDITEGGKFKEAPYPGDAR